MSDKETYADKILDAEFLTKALRLKDAQLQCAIELVRRLYCLSCEAQSNEREGLSTKTTGDYLIEIESLCRLFLRDHYGFSDAAKKRDGEKSETIGDIVQDIEECYDCFDEDANAFLGEIASRIREARDARLFNLCKEGGV